MGSESCVCGYSRAACTILTHAVCIIFTILITVLSRPGSSLFSWHPFLMTLAFSFMTEAILLFSPHGSLMRTCPHKSKVRLHWMLQCACLACAALGLAAIACNKNRTGKAHLTSWHGVTGLVTVCAVAVQCLAAVPLISPSILKGWSLATLKRSHAAAGLLTYLLGSGSLLLGVRSTWFVASVGELGWYLAALCPALCGLVIMDQVTNAYMAKKRLQS